MRGRHGRQAACGAAAIIALIVSLAPPVGAATPAAPTKRVIVELTGEPALARGAALHSADPASRAAAVQRVQQRVAGLRTEHAQFRDTVRNAGITAHVTANLTQLVNAVALTVPANDVAALRGLPGVAAVYPDTQLHASADEDVTITGAPQVWQTTDPAGNPDRGTGETVAVVDTGIDYTHPDLGGGFGPGHKVVGGYDFVNGDDDPMDDNGHGTHVAGIVAGDPAGPGGRIGEAPGASLTAYKVLDASGYGDEATIIEGIEAAVAVDNPHRADVINLSLGGPPEADDPLEQACEQAIASGTVVVAAVGNDGPGESTVGSPAEAPDVLAVGASITGVQLPTVAVTSPVQRTLQVQRLGLSGNPPTGGETLDVVDVGNGLPGSYDGIDASGKAVLAAYNSFQLPDVIAAAEQHGAAALLLYTPNYYSSLGRQPGPLPDFAAGLADDPDKLDIVATVLNGTDATDLRQWLADGPVQVHIGATDATDLLASFSSQGPAPGSYALKPDLVAPGVEIGSTWPGGTYRDDSGTSMAAPHVAGAAALLREAHPDWTAAQIAAALTGGSTPLNGYTGTEVGAGRLDVAHADQLGLLAQPRIANLGLADQSSSAATGTGTVTLTNVSARPSTVHLTADQAPGSAAHVDVSPHAARLAPGGQLQVTISVRDQQSTGADLSGWLVATPDAGPALTVPYLLAVRPLDLHVSPDPAVGATTVYVHAEPTLGSAPVVTVSPPTGAPVTVTATFDHTGWWRASLPAGPVGTYQISANAQSELGPVLTGSTSYQQTGPGTGHWQSVGPDNEGAYEMAATSQPGRMYALPTMSAHAGVFRTDDSGATWHELRNLPVADGTTMGLAADPADPDNVYLAVQGAGADPTYQGKILVSHDAGATWTTLPYPDVAMQDLSLDASGRILTVPASNGNVYVSLDRGQTWTAYPSPDGYPQQARVIGHDLFIAAGSSLYAVRDVDGTPSAPQKVLTAPVWYESMIDVVGDGHVLLARTFDQVFASYDAGATWQTLFTPPDDDPFISSMQIVHGDIYLGGSQDIWVDHGEGTTWTSLPTPVPSDNFTVSSFDPAGSGLVVSGSFTGLFATNDAGTSYQRVGLAGAQVSALAVTHDATGRTTLLAGTPQGPFETPLPERSAPTAATRDWGITDDELVIGDRFVSLSTDPEDPQTVYAVRANAFSRVDIQESTDGGASWDELEGTRVSAHAYQIIDDPADPDYVYVTINDSLSPGLLVSRDGGQTWRKNNLPVLVTAVAADPTNPARILLGGPSGLYLSMDGGQTITQLSSAPVSAITIDPHDGSHVLVGGAGLFVSRDGGRTLRRTDGMPYPLRITAIAITPDGTAYAADGAGTDTAGLPVGGRGVLTSDNGGDHWTSLSAGLANLDVESLAVDGGWLFAGTSGGGVYRLAT